MSGHIDEIVSGLTGSSEWFRASLEAFRLVVEQLMALDTPAQPLLVIPLLSGSTQLQATVPSELNMAMTMADDLEPPSLYLLAWEAWFYLDETEEYKVPLKFELIDPPIQGIYEYYREFRTREGLERGWEFDRSIYVAYYPLRYRIETPEM